MKTKNAMENEFDLNKLKKEAAAVVSVAKLLTEKHNPGIDLKSDIARKITQGFVNDLEYLLRFGVIEIKYS